MSSRKEASLVEFVHQIRFLKSAMDFLLTPEEIVSIRGETHYVTVDGEKKIDEASSKMH